MRVCFFQNVETIGFLSGVFASNCQSFLFYDPIFPTLPLQFVLHLRLSIYLLISTFNLFEIDLPIDHSSICSILPPMSFFTFSLSYLTPFFVLWSRFNYLLYSFIILLSLSRIFFDSILIWCVPCEFRFRLP